MSRIKLTWVAILSLGLSGVSSAESIGINFVNTLNDNTAATSLTPEQSAGAPGVEQAHWNNLEVTNDDPNGHGNSGVLKDLIDSKGKRVRRLAVLASGDKAQNKQLFQISGAPWGFSGDDLVMKTGMLYPGGNLTLEGIPYRSYDVYVYVGAGSDGGGNKTKVTIEAAPGVRGKVDDNHTYYTQINWTEGTYAPAEDTEGNPEGGNVVRFTGNTASDITIGWSPHDAKFNQAGVTGIQIVETRP